MNHKNMAAHLNIRSGRTVKFVGLTKPSRLMVLIAAMIVWGIHSSYGAIGETEDRCNRRYGSGTVTRFDQQTKTKSIRYEHPFSADVDVHFQNGQATFICYSGHYPITMGESDISRILDEESDGHNWTLLNSNGKITHNWLRDDGITAFEYLEPDVASDPRTFLAISIPPKLEPKKPEPTFVQVLGKALLVGVGFGVGVYVVIKLLLLGLEALSKIRPKQ